MSGEFLMTDDEPTIDEVRDELRSAMNILLLMATGNKIEGNSERTNGLNEVVRNMAAFGVNSKLISKLEYDDWCEVIAEKKLIVDVLKKYDRQFQKIIARKEEKKKRRNYRKWTLKNLVLIGF